MKTRVMLIVAGLLAATGCHKSLRAIYPGNALLVTHTPNPSNINSSEHFPKPRFPFTWYYRTEVRNNSDRPLKIVWFESYFDNEGYWWGGNVLNRVLRNDVFSRWYGEPDDKSEWIKPGHARTCDPNWHGSLDPEPPDIKWAYIAVDQYGNDYYGEAIIKSVPIEVNEDQPEP